MFLVILPSELKLILILLSKSQYIFEDGSNEGNLIFFRNFSTFFPEYLNEFVMVCSLSLLPLFVLSFTVYNLIFLIPVFAINDCELDFQN